LPNKGWRSAFPDPSDHRERPLDAFLRFGQGERQQVGRALFPNLVLDGTICGGHMHDARRDGFGKQLKKEPTSNGNGGTSSQ
jgi:hypothetical protein